MTEHRFFTPVDAFGFRYMPFIGRVDGKRAIRYIREDYVRIPDTCDPEKPWSVVIAEANGGEFGHTFADPMIVGPGTIVCEGDFA